MDFKFKVGDLVRCTDPEFGVIDSGRIRNIVPWSTFPYRVDFPDFPELPMKEHELIRYQPKTGFAKFVKNNNL